MSAPEQKQNAKQTKFTELLTQTAPVEGVDWLVDEDDLFTTVRERKYLEVYEMAGW